MPWFREKIRSWSRRLLNVLLQHCYFQVEKIGMVVQNGNFEFATAGKVRLVAIISMNKINKMDRTHTYIRLTNKKLMDTIRKKKHI